MLASSVFNTVPECSVRFLGYLVDSVVLGIVMSKRRRIAGFGGGSAIQARQKDVGLPDLVREWVIVVGMLRGMAVVSG